MGRGRWQSRRVRGALAATGLITVGLLAGACGTDDAEDAPTTAVPDEMTAIGEPGVDRSPFEVSYGTATGDGDDLVVISPDGNAALRRDDGTWWELPPVPFQGYIQLATAGGRAVAGGIAAQGPLSDDGEVAFAILSEDRSEWIRLDAPDVAVSVSETEMTTSPGPSPLAQFSIGSDAYVVDDSGRVDRWEPIPTEGPANSAEYGCLVGDTYVSVHLEEPELGSDPMGVYGLVGDVYLQPVDGSEEPISVGPVPDGLGSPGYLCAGGSVSFGVGPQQAVLDVSDGTWSVEATNLGELSGGGFSPISGRLASSPDSSTAFLLASNGQIIRRLSNNMWEPSGAAGHVFSTGSQVIVIDGDLNAVPIWPS
jgi:hypothetical protein